MTQREFKRLEKFIQRALAEKSNSYHGWVTVFEYHLIKIEKKPRLYISDSVSTDNYIKLDKVINGNNICGVHFKHIQKVNLWFSSFETKVLYF